MRSNIVLATMLVKNRNDPMPLQFLARIHEIGIVAIQHTAAIDKSEVASHAESCALLLALTIPILINDPPMAIIATNRNTDAS